MQSFSYDCREHSSNDPSKNAKQADCADPSSAGKLQRKCLENDCGAYFPFFLWTTGLDITIPFYDFFS